MAPEHDDADDVPEVEAPDDEVPAKPRTPDEARAWKLADRLSLEELRRAVPSRIAGVTLSAQEEQALRALETACRKVVESRAHGVVPHERDEIADEVMFRVFTDLYEQAVDVARVRNLGAWLSTVGYRKALDTARSPRATRVRLVPPVGSEQQDAAETTLESVAPSSGPDPIEQAVIARLRAAGLVQGRHRMLSRATADGVCPLHVHDGACSVFAGGRTALQLAAEFVDELAGEYAGVPATQGWSGTRLELASLAADLGMTGERIRRIEQPCLIWWAHLAVSHVLHPVPAPALDEMRVDGAWPQLPRTLTPVKKLPPSHPLRRLRSMVGPLRWAVLDRFRLTASLDLDRSAGISVEGALLLYAEPDIQLLVDRHMTAVADLLKGKIK